MSSGDLCPYTTKCVLPETGCVDDIVMGYGKHAAHNECPEFACVDKSQSVADGHRVLLLGAMAVRRPTTKGLNMANLIKTVGETSLKILCGTTRHRDRFHRRRRGCCQDN
jgi:hypothetical protein